MIFSVYVDPRLHTQERTKLAARDVASATKSQRDQQMAGVILLQTAENKSSLLNYFHKIGLLWESLFFAFSVESKSHFLKGGEDKENMAVTTSSLAPFFLLSGDTKWIKYQEALYLMKYDTNVAYTAALMLFSA